MSPRVFSTSMRLRILALLPCSGLARRVPWLRRTSAALSSSSAMLSSTLMPSIVVVVRLSPPLAVSSMPLSLLPSPVSASPSTSLRSRPPRMPLVVSTLPSTPSVVSSSRRPRGPVLPCTTSRLTSPSLSPSVSPLSFALTPLVKLSPSASSIIGRCFPTTPLRRVPTPTPLLPVFVPARVSSPSPPLSPSSRISSKWFHSIQDIVCILLRQTSNLVVL
mmetsp:Transcript_14922/g.26361  ORF Transcript_14922/g.26361 Transcript_14922/m.26361 type:complete len:219 (+) Transcript_14922:2055-2711(+)